MTDYDKAIVLVVMWCTGVTVLAFMIAYMVNGSAYVERCKRRDGGGYFYEMHERDQPGKLLYCAKWVPVWWVAIAVIYIGLFASEAMFVYRTLTAG